MSKADLHRLIDDLPDDAVDGATVLVESVLRHEIDPAQAWVWTTEWQDKLRKSLADLAAGRARRFESGEGFLAAL